MKAFSTECKNLRLHVIPECTDPHHFAQASQKLFFNREPQLSLRRTNIFQSIESSFPRCQLSSRRSLLPATPLSRIRFLPVPTLSVSFSYSVVTCCQPQRHLSQIGLESLSHRDYHGRVFKGGLLNNIALGAPHVGGRR